MTATQASHAERFRRLLERFPSWTAFLASLSRKPCRTASDLARDITADGHKLTLDDMALCKERVNRYGVQVRGIRDNPWIECGPERMLAIEHAWEQIERVK